MAKIIKFKKPRIGPKQIKERISEKKAAENYFEIPSCLIEICKTNTIVAHVLNEYCHKFDLKDEKYFREMLIVCIKELCRNDFYGKAKEVVENFNNNTDEGDDDNVARNIPFGKKD